MAIFLSFYFSGFAQYDITPGKGFSDIKLKMHIDDIISVIGQPKSMDSFEEEKALWENFGYDAEKGLPFYIGFDEVYKFDNNKYAIWKVYVKKNKAVYIVLSSYGIEERILEKISVLNSIKFFDNLSKITSVMGDEYYTKIDEGGNESFFFLNKGIEFIMDDGELRNVYFFKRIRTNKKVIQELGLKLGK